MLTLEGIKKKLEKAFDERQATVLTEVIVDAYSELVKTSDFNELKAIVKELAEAQKRTELKVEELAEAQKRTELKMGELAEAQKESQKEISRLDKTMQELAEAQKRTELKVEELAEAQKETEKEIQRLVKGLNETREEVQLLVRGLNETRGELGGLSRSVGYALENEAYRLLPKLLKKSYGIELEEKLIRAEIGGKEINIFGKAKRDGGDVLIVGETKLRLDDRRKTKDERDVFEELEEKVMAVREEYEGEEIVRVLITHYATKGFMMKSKEKGVIVVQSFEWQD